MSEPDPAPRPLLRIVGGDASPEQIAVLVALLAVRGVGAHVENAPAAPSRWSARQLPGPLPHGAGAWKAAASPR